MGSVYKDKKGSSCGCCKPHKNGWGKKHKAKHRALSQEHKRQIDRAQAIEGG